MWQHPSRHGGAENFNTPLAVFEQVYAIINQNLQT